VSDGGERLTVRFWQDEAYPDGTIHSLQKANEEYTRLDTLGNGGELHTTCLALFDTRVLRDKNRLFLMSRGHEREFILYAPIGQKRILRRDTKLQRLLFDNQIGVELN